MTNLFGKTVRLDIFAEDSSGKRYDIEIQKSDSGAITRRARYNSSIMDANALPTGDDYTILPDTYVIFITENDVIGSNKPICHIKRTIMETGLEFGDGSHIIYVNSAYKDDSPLGRLMEDFYCKKTDDMNYPTLAEKVRYFKESEGGVSGMSKIMEEYAKEYANQQLKEERKKTAIKLINLDLSFDKISIATGLSLDEVKELAGEKTA